MKDFREFLEESASSSFDGYKVFTKEIAEPIKAINDTFYSILVDDHALKIVDPHTESQMWDLLKKCFITHCQKVMQKYKGPEREEMGNYLSGFLTGYYTKLSKQEAEKLVQRWL